MPRRVFDGDGAAGLPVQTTIAPRGGGASMPDLLRRLVSVCLEPCLERLGYDVLEATPAAGVAYLVAEVAGYAGGEHDGFAGLCRRELRLEFGNAFFCYVVAGLSPFFAGPCLACLLACPISCCLVCHDIRLCACRTVWQYGMHVSRETVMHAYMPVGRATAGRTMRVALKRRPRRAGLPAR